MEIHKEQTQQAEKPIYSVKQMARHLGMPVRSFYRIKPRLKIYGSGKMQFAFPSELNASIKSL